MFSFICDKELKDTLEGDQTIIECKIQSIPNNSLWD